MYAITPSILVYSQEAFLEQINTIKSVCSYVQVDIADGVFVEGKTWIDPEFVKEHMVIDFELHMMVHNPIEEMQRWKDIDHLKRIVFHYESVDDIEQAVADMKQFGREISVCLNPDTPIDVLDAVIDQIDGMQFMSVYPGKQGQSFINATLDRIKALHAKYPGLSIADDGAVNKETLPQLVHAGATRFGPGSAVWKGDAVKNYEELVALMEEHAKHLKEGHELPVA